MLHSSIFFCKAVATGCLKQCLSLDICFRVHFVFNMYIWNVFKKICNSFSNLYWASVEAITFFNFKMNVPEMTEVSAGEIWSELLLCRADVSP